MKGKLSFLSILLRKRKASSVAQPIPSEADKKVAEKVRYSTGLGSVKLGQNADYEGAEYEDEEVYEVPTWSADILYALHECNYDTFLDIVL